MDKIIGDIAKNIKKYRKLNKMTQKELADMVGVSTAAVSNWETGANSIDVDSLFKVCKALNVSVTEISEQREDFALNITEKQIIENYRKAPAWKQLNVLKMLNVETLPARLRHYLDLMSELKD